MFTNLNQVLNFFDERKQFGIKPGLDRMKTLLNELGNPEDHLKAIHVTGTNGKGSTIHFLKAALIENGYHVGVFTSPSMYGLTGHILLDNQPIDNNDFLSILNVLYPTIEKLDAENNHPTEFEIITAMMFLYFKNRTDIALIETGMGARFDTTNCFTPIVSIITNISLDHMAFLGQTTREIAYHKAGVIKQGVPVVIGDLDREAMSVVCKEALQLHAPSYEWNHEFSLKNYQRGTKYQSFVWQSDDSSPITVHTKMKGIHQSKNASLALMALQLLLDKGYAINWDQVIKGFGQAQMAGRFEMVQENPLVIVDGAHNVGGMVSFLETVKKWYPTAKKQLLFAGFKDKNLPEMLQKACDVFQEITITSFSHPRAIRADQLHEMIGIERVAVQPNWKEAIETLSTEKDQITFITGSLAFITMVRNYFQQK